MKFARLMRFGLLGTLLFGMTSACDAEVLPMPNAAGVGGASGHSGGSTRGDAGSAGASTHHTGGTLGTSGAGGAGGTGGIENVAGSTANAGGGSGMAGTAGAAPKACGDSDVEAPEACDDGNTARCDGCESCEKRYVLELPSGAHASIDGLEALLPKSTAPLCFEAWVKSDGSVEDAIYLSSASSEADINFLLGCFTDSIGTEKLTTLRFSVRNADKQTSAEPPIACHDGQWHHVAACRSTVADELSLRIHWDGKPIAAAGGTVDSIGTPAPLFIAGSNFQKTGLGGAIDEISIGQRLRSNEFIPVRRQIVTSLTLALYHLDEGLGETFANAAPHELPGTLIDARWSIDRGYKPGICE